MALPSEIIPWKSSCREGLILKTMVSQTKTFEFCKKSCSGDYVQNFCTNLTPEERACRGMFMSFQYPIAIPGVNTMHFLRTAVNSIRKYKGEKEILPSEFISKFKKILKLIGLSEDFARRSVNDGFSGG